MAHQIRVVLHIDDDDASRGLFERILLRRPGIRLLSADEGRAGLRLAREHRPDLVVSDLRLPDLTGHEVLLALRADPSLQHIPVVITSGEARPQQIDEVTMAGAAAYLTKPFSIDRLLELVDRYTEEGLPTVSGPTPSPGPAVGSDRGSGEGPLAADALDQLRRLQSRMAPDDPLIGDFLNDAEHLVAALAAGVDAGDLDGAERAAHNLAGSSAMFAAEVVSGLATQVERHLMLGHTEAARALVGDLPRELARAAEALRREFPVP